MYQLASPVTEWEAPGAFTRRNLFKCVVVVRYWIVLNLLCEHRGRYSSIDGSHSSECIPIRHQQGHQPNWDPQNNVFICTSATQTNLVQWMYLLLNETGATILPDHEENYIGAWGKWRRKSIEPIQTGKKPPPLEANICSKGGQGK